MTDKLVCICVPLYNAASTIASTLDSLLAQTYSPLVIHVFDNASTDDSPKILSEYVKSNPQIHYHRFEENVGGEGNFTRCLQGASGHYTGVFHSDDIYYPFAIEDSVKAFEEFPQISACVLAADRVDAGGVVRGRRFIPPEYRDKVSLIGKEALLRSALKYGNFITCPGVVTRSEIYRENIKVWNGYDFRTSADLDVWLRVIELGPMAFMADRPRMGYRVADASYSYRIANQRTTRHDIFLVLNARKDEFCNDKEACHDYDLLLVKDDVNISINLYLNNQNLAARRRARHVISHYGLPFLLLDRRGWYYLIMILGVLTLSRLNGCLGNALRTKIAEAKIT